MLNEIEFEPNYNSYNNNMANDFYSKALSNSIIYSRVSAYFSAKSICNISKGIVPFYLHGGKMKLIISAEISEEDYNVIKLGYERKKIEKIYNRVWEGFKYDELSDMQKDKIANVAFLISNNALEIKMAFKTEGIFHDKFGLIQDENNNCVYFRGSNNETLAAIEKNYESFDVTCSWLASEFEMKRISNARIQFSKLWNNEINNLFIIDLPEVIKNKILSYNRGKIVDNTLDKELIICFDVDEEKKRLFATFQKG